MIQNGAKKSLNESCSRDTWCCHLKVCGHVTETAVLLNNDILRLCDEKPVQIIWMSFTIFKIYLFTVYQVQYSTDLICFIEGFLRTGCGTI